MSDQFVRAELNHHVDELASERTRSAELASALRASLAEIELARMTQQERSIAVHDAFAFGGGLGAEKAFGYKLRTIVSCAAGDGDPSSCTALAQSLCAQGYEPACEALEEEALSAD